DRIAHDYGSCGDSRGRLSVKLQDSVGRRIDLRRVRSARNVCAADTQRTVAKGVRELDPYFCPASAGMHDQPHGLVVEGLQMSWRGWLRGRRPGSDPLFLDSILSHR